MRFFHWLQHCFERDRNRLVLWIPVALGAGCAAYFALTFEPPEWAAPLVALGAGVLAWLARRHMPALIPLALVIAAIGFSVSQMQTHRLHTPVLAEPIFWKTMQGRVNEIIIAEKAHKVVLGNPAIESLAPDVTPKQVRISFRKWDDRVAIGDVIRMKATAFPLPRPVVPGAFDFGRYLYFQGLGGVGYTTQLPEVIATDGDGQSAIDQFRYAFATDIIKRLDTPYGAIAAALTVGEQHAIPDEVNEMLRDSGLYHILSISGLHLAIAAGIVFYVVRLLLALIPGLALRWPIKKIAAGAALIASLLYLLAAGAPVPAQRSFIMVAVVFAAILVDRKGISMVSLAWAAVLILLLKPESITSASFHLSFAATAAIVAFYESYGGMVYRPANSWVSKAFVAVLATVMISLVATLATMPFVMTHFNRIQLWGMIANAAVSPITAFMVMPGVVLSFVLLPVGLEGLGYQWLEWGLVAMMKVAQLVAGLPYASISIPSLTPVGFIACSLGMIWLLLWKARWRALGLVMMAGGLLTILQHHAPDMLIGDDGKQVAVKGVDGDFILLKGSGRSFTAEQWARQNGQEVLPTWKEAVKSGAEGIECEKTHCLWRHTSYKVIYINSPKAIRTVCKSKPDILITAYRVWNEECAGVSLVIDRNALEARGAHSVTLTEAGIEVEDAQQYMGERPWVK